MRKKASIPIRRKATKHSYEALETRHRSVRSISSSDKKQKHTSKIALTLK